MGAAIQTYGYQFVTPIMDAAKAARSKIAVSLKASTTYARGSLLGELSGTPGTYALYVPIASYGSPASEVDTLTITASGGTYQLDIGGELTPTIAYNAIQATIQTAVNAALAAIPGAGTITVGGTGPFTFTYGGSWANTNVPAIEPVVVGLTGGGATVVRTTSGASGAPTDGSQKAMVLLPFDCITDASGNITRGTNITAGAGAYGITSLTADVYTEGIFNTADVPNYDANALAQCGRSLGNGRFALLGG